MVLYLVAQAIGNTGMNVRDEGLLGRFEGPLGTVLLRDVVGLIDSPSKCHDGHVNGCHLSGQHGLRVRVVPGSALAM